MTKALKRVLLAFGTRPEAIKMAPVYHALRARSDSFEPLSCVTGQHRAMLDQALEIFGIVPDFDLDLMREGQDLTDIHCGVLQGMRSVLYEVRPDLVLVHGDTTTSMASATAAFYAQIPIAHVEAGLRTPKIMNPFPEELNRRSTALVSRYHFAPTEANRAILLAEGHDPASIVVTGNTVIDALDFVLARMDADPARRACIESDMDGQLAFDWRRERFIVVTCHRREDQAARLRELSAALNELSGDFPGVHFVIPLHPNPAIRLSLNAGLADRDNVHLIQPLAYDVFVHMLRSCHLVLTDSGGLQEEAPHLGKPVLLMRDVTERVEAIDAGGVRMIGTECDRIVAGVSELLTDRRSYGRMADAPNPYGDGSAAHRIADFLAAL